MFVIKRKTAYERRISDWRSDVCCYDLESRQVLCVTHLPQVAAQGHAHYRVSKAASDGVTQSAEQQLDARQRQEELARMLGGVEVSTEARAAAKRLLRNAS